MIQSIRRAIEANIVNLILYLNGKEKRFCDNDTINARDWMLDETFCTRTKRIASVNRRIRFDQFVCFFFSIRSGLSTGEQFIMSA